MPPALPNSTCTLLCWTTKHLVPNRNISRTSAFSGHPYLAHHLQDGSQHGSSRATGVLRNHQTASRQSKLCSHHPQKAYQCTHRINNSNENQRHFIAIGQQFNWSFQVWLKHANKCGHYYEALDKRATKSKNKQDEHKKKSLKTRQPKEEWNLSMTELWPWLCRMYLLESDGNYCSCVTDHHYFSNRDVKTVIVLISGSWWLSATLTILRLKMNRSWLDSR